MTTATASVFALLLFVALLFVRHFLRKANERAAEKNMRQRLKDFYLMRNVWICIAKEEYEFGGPGGAPITTIILEKKEIRLGPRLEFPCPDDRIVKGSTVRLRPTKKGETISSSCFPGGEYLIPEFVR